MGDTNCSNDYPSTSTLYNELKDHKGTAAVLGICGCLCLIVIAIYIEEIWFLVRWNSSNRQRNKFIFLLGIYPVISLLSLLLLLVPVTSLVAELISAMYLSCAVFVFVKLIIDYFDGVDNLLQSMMGENLAFSTPPICCLFRSCLKNIPFTRGSFKFARVLVLQVIIIRPLALLVTMILWIAGYYIPGDESEPKNAVFYSNLINVLSSITSIWGLVVLFRATRDKLGDVAIIPKFVSLKLVITFFNIQFLVINQLAKAGKIPCEGTLGSLIRGIRIQNMLLIFEMFFVSILARFAYRRQDKQE